MNYLPTNRVRSLLLRFDFPTFVAAVVRQLKYSKMSAWYSALDSYRDTCYHLRVTYYPLIAKILLPARLYGLRKSIFFFIVLISFDGRPKCMHECV